MKYVVLLPVLITSVTASAAPVSRRGLFQGGALGLLAKMVPARAPAPAPTPGVAAVAELRRAQLAASALDLPGEVWEFSEISLLDKAAAWVRANVGADPVVEADLATLRHADTLDWSRQDFGRTTPARERLAKTFSLEKTHRNLFVDKLLKFELEVAEARGISIVELNAALRWVIHPGAMIEDLLAGRREVDVGFGVYDDALVDRTLAVLDDLAPDYARRVRRRQITTPAEAMKHVEQYVYRHGGAYSPLVSTNYAADISSMKSVADIDAAIADRIEAGGLRLTGLLRARDKIGVLASSRLSDLVTSAMDEVAARLPGQIADIPPSTWRFVADARRVMRGPKLDPARAADAAHWAGVIGQTFARAGITLARAAATEVCQTALTADAAPEAAPALTHQPAQPLPLGEDVETQEIERVPAARSDAPEPK